MIPEFEGRPVFPVPKFSEDFFDDAVARIGGRRLTSEEICELEKNSDYLMPGATIELKILEEEGLEKEERQDRIAALYSKLGISGSIINIDPSKIPEEMLRDFIRIVSGPIQTCVKKAAQQIKETKNGLKRPFDLGILLLANNGYKFLDLRNLLEIAIKHASNDTSQIDFVFCTSIEYHQGEFDSYVFCKSEYNSVVGISKNETLDQLRGVINEKFTDLMTQMMRNLHAPSLWNNSTSPVKDILFRRDGVEFVRLAPIVPDSRFQNKNDIS